MNQRLKSLSGRRYDGAWELLATAAGNHDAVGKSCQMLSGVVLDDFVHPDWMVAERVEALGAYDPLILASLARDWPTPVNSASPFISTAWRVALRHLLPILQLNHEEFDVPELSEETSVVWRSKSETPISWNQAFDLVDAQPIFNSTIVRRLAQHPLTGSLPSRDELVRSPAWMLPLLRGHVHRLDHNAKDYLAECGTRCLGSDLRSGSYVAWKISVDQATESLISTGPIKYIPLGALKLEGNASAAPPIIELCREIGGELLDDLENLFADQLSRVVDPKLAAPLAYLLLTGWTLP